MKGRKSLFHVTVAVCVLTWSAVQWNAPLCQPLLGGFHMLAYTLNPPCPGFVLSSWLSNANPNERSKKFLFSSLVNINGSALVQEVEVVSVSGPVFCHSLKHLHGLVLKCSGLSCIKFSCSVPSRVTGHGGETWGALEAVPDRKFIKHLLI